MKACLFNLLLLIINFFFLYPIADINNVSDLLISIEKLPEELHTVEFFVFKSII